VTFRFCDDLGEDGFGWVADEAISRTSHALAQCVEITVGE